MYMKYRTSKLVNGLIKITAGGLVVGAGVISPNIIQLLKPFIKNADNKALDFELKRLIRHMKRLNLIVLEKHNDGSSYVKLTKKGTDRLKEVEIEEITIDPPKKWDGLWRIVSFDIKQEKKNERYEFLAQLHRLGFVRAYQSMWVYPFPSTKEIMTIAKLIGIDGEVMVIEGKLTEDRHLDMLKTFKSVIKNI